MRIRLGIALGAALIASLAACGGGDDDDGIASAGGTSSPTSSTDPGAQTEEDQIFAYAQCMRDNGVTSFQDPEVGENGELRMDLNADGIDPQVLDKAQETCRPLLPNGGEPQQIDPERQEQLRQYAQCMRDNGIEDFPDPTDQGLQIQAEPGSELDPNNPAFQAADAACSQYAPAPPGGSESELRTGSEGDNV